MRVPRCPDKLGEKVPADAPACRDEPQRVEWRPQHSCHEAPRGNQCRAHAKEGRFEWMSERKLVEFCVKHHGGYIGHREKPHHRPCLANDGAGQVSTKPIRGPPNEQRNRGDVQEC